MTRARDALATWRTELNATVNLEKALAEQESAKALGKAIQEAGAAGLRVQDARKVLKALS